MSGRELTLVGKVACAAFLKAIKIVFVFICGTYFGWILCKSEIYGGMFARTIQIAAERELPVPPPKIRKELK